MTACLLGGSMLCLVLPPRKAHATAALGVYLQAFQCYKYST